MTASEASARRAAPPLLVSRLRWRSALILVLGMGVGGLTNLATSGLEIGRWRWLLTIGLVVLGLAWALLDAFTGRGLEDPADSIGSRLQGLSSTPWMVPKPDREPVDRLELVAEVVQMLMQSSATIGLTTALHGAGGFGKTTLAILACRDAEIAQRYRGGLLWVTLSEHHRDTDVAVSINDLCELLSGYRPTLADPEKAGYVLGQLLDDRPPMLVVIDNVWTADQLRPFLLGGRTATRLVTTRMHGLLPESATSIHVDEMAVPEARRLLASGLPPIPLAEQDELIALTGRWPLLLSLANGALRRSVRATTSAAEAARELARRLRTQGPASLDLTVERLRNQAVSSVIDASASLLTAAHYQLFRELAIFPQERDIPLSVVGVLWGSQGLNDIRVAALCEELAELSLVASFDRRQKTIRLHSVVSQYLRHSWDGTGLQVVNRRLVAQARQLLPEDAKADNADAQWWDLPVEAQYFWQYLCFHLQEAGYHDQLTSLVCDLRWIEKRIRLADIGSVESDLFRSEGSIASHLQRSLARAAHLLRPLEPAHALADVLLSRLADQPELEAVCASYLRHRPAQWPRIKNVWPLPDHYRSLRRVLVGHDAGVVTCAISSDGKTILTAAIDGSVRFWDAFGREQSRLDAHPGGVRALAVAGDASWLATSGYDGTAFLWESSGTRRATLSGHRGIDAYAAPHDGSWLLSIGSDRTIRIWDTDTGQQRADLGGGSRLSDHLDRASGCAVSADGSWLLTGGMDGIIRMWNVETGLPQMVVAGHTGVVNGCSIAVDGTWFCSTSDDGTARMWDSATGELIHVLDGHVGPVASCAIAPDGTWLVTVGSDRTARIWDCRTGELRCILTGHTDQVTSCAIAPDGTWLLTTSWDRTARVWEVPAEADRSSTTGHAERVTGCRPGPRGDWVVTSSWDHTVGVWEVPRGQVKQILKGHNDKVTSCAVAPNGRWLVTTSWDNTARIWNAVTGKQRLVLSGHRDRVSTCAIAPDGKWIATAGEDMTVRLWETKRGRLLHTLTGHKDRVTGCAVNPLGNWLVTVAFDGGVRIWDTSDVLSASTQPEQDALPAVSVSIDLPRGLTACSVSPDGLRLAIASEDRTIRILRNGEFALENLLSGHTLPVTSCSFSPDGRWLASTGDDQCLYVWDVERGCLAASLRVDGGLADTHWLADQVHLCAAGAGGTYLFAFDPGVDESGG